MADPTTGNILLAVPSHGSDVNTWDVPVNSNSTAIDGYLGGVGAVSLSNANVTLTAPGGTVTPGSGPTQAQNAVLRFNGTLTANVQVTLPLPGYYIIENLTSGNFVVTFAAPGGAEIIATPQGSCMHIFNDGSAVRFVTDISSFPGKMEFLGGVATLPAWVNACTVKPFLIADGSVYNYTSYPALANLYAGNFGGNGITTFGVPDLRGRIPLAYDSTGARITAAGSGVNGKQIGAFGGAQNFTLIRSDLPNDFPAVTISDTRQLGITQTSLGEPLNYTGSAPGGVGAVGIAASPSLRTLVANCTNVLSGAISGLFALNGGVTQTSHANLPPTQVSGIWMIKT